MRTPAPPHRTLDAVERLCGSHAGDDRALRIEVLDLLRHAIGFDAHAWLLTDPRTAVGSSPLADVPCLDRLPQLIRLKYLTDVNRWTTLAGAPSPVGLLQRDTAGAPASSLVWRELQWACGVTDVASVVFADHLGCWGFLDLWRIQPAEAFAESDAALLSSLAPAVTTALRHCQARTFAAPPALGRGDLGPMVLVLDDQLRLLSQTDAAATWLEALLPAGGANRTIPAAAYNVGAQLLAVEHGTALDPPSARVHVTGGLWATLRAARLDGDRIAVTIEETSGADRLDLFRRCHALSGREAEVLVHLAAGGSTRELAATMFVSAHTVQDHLKSIFAKTGARSRRDLLSRALGVG